MLDIGKISPTIPTAAEGRVVVEYTDGVTGKVKERIAGDNYVFPGGLLIAGLPSVLGFNQGSILNVLLSDYSGAVDTGVPCVPGNLIGYGMTGSSASGTYLGAENIAGRSLGVLSGGKVHYKRQWSWLPTQVPSTIKKIGLACRPGEFFKDFMVNNTIFLPRPISFRFNSTSHKLFDMDRGFCYEFVNDYTSSNNLALYRHVFGTYPSTEIKWPQLLKIPDHYSTISYGGGCFFLDVSAGNIHFFYIYQSTEMQGGTRLCKMCKAVYTAGFSSLVSQTYTTLGTAFQYHSFSGQNSGWCNVGILASGIYYLPHTISGTAAKWCSFDPSNAVGNGGTFVSSCIAEQSTFLLPKYTEDSYCTVNGQFNTGITVSANSVAVTLPSNLSGYQITNIFKASNLSAPYATTRVYGYSEPETFLFAPHIADAGGIPVLASYRASTTGGKPYDNNEESWVNQSALTCYSLPNDAPVRQPGQGVSVTYEVALGY